MMSYLAISSGGWLGINRQCWKGEVDGQTQRGTGIIMVEMQETERAVQLFSKLTTLDPDNESVKQQLRNLQLHQTY